MMSKHMATASPMTARASGPSLLIIKKQQDQWDQQQTALMYIMTIKYSAFMSSHDRLDGGRGGHVE